MYLTNTLKYIERHKIDFIYHICQSAPIWHSSTPCALPLQTSSVPAHPYHTAPSDVYRRSSEKPCSHPSEHNQFLLQWSTMRPLQPLTPSSILPLFTSAAAGCATQMGLCSAMKWARRVRVQYILYVFLTDTSRGRWRWWHRVIYIPVGHIWESPRDKLVRFRIPVCQTEGRSAVWFVSITRNATKG